MKGLVGGPLLVGGLGPVPLPPPLKSGPTKVETFQYLSFKVVVSSQRNRRRGSKAVHKLKIV